MLYLTTRSKTDSYTDYRTLFEDKAPNGGFFIPYQIPQLDPKQISELKTKSFGETVAFILNLFYAGRITAWDIDCCIGKMPVQLVSANQRIFLAKLWGNPEKSYQFICRKIYAKLCADERDECTNWAYIAIRVSVLFGIYGILQNSGIKSFDICVNSNFLSDAMAVWYARYMGLPIGRIICSGSENGIIWDLFYKGELNTSELLSDSADHTAVERLIFAAIGFDETQKFVDASNKKGIYRVSADRLKELNRGMHIFVVSKERSAYVLSAFLAANGILLDPFAAESCGGLQDFRSKTGESTNTVLLWDHSPVHFVSAIEKATGFNRQEIEKYNG